MSQNKTIVDLRESLFKTIAALQDKDNPMDIARAKAISDVAQTMVNLEKVEVDYLKMLNGAVVGSGFIPLTNEQGEPAKTTATGLISHTTDSKGIPTTTHRIRG